MGTYVKITQEEMDNFLTTQGMHCINPQDQYKELMYEKRWGEGKYILRVYSSIVQSQNASRDKGADAIRVVLFVAGDTNFYPVSDLARVYRTTNWMKNLALRIIEGQEIGCYGRNWQCKNCGSPMLRRKGRAGFFLGCTKFSSTGCRYTENW